MRLSSVWSRENLLLAWRRVTTGTNLAYKRYFRPIYYAYEIALSDNLRDLHARLDGRSFQPRQPTRVYIPKPSGLQRPLTLLAVEDQIVLQAIANVFASKTQRRRRKVEHKSVFSNIVQRPASSIFFLQKWQHSYALFQAKIEQYFSSGLRWIAHFDLAAFYDTVCHDMLLRTAFPRTTDGGRDAILRCLKTWSSELPGSSHGHGVPQGPIGSDFLCECFLLPVDEALQKQRLRYIRYVDDIRLFGKSQDQVRAAAIRMEILLRERGLIPQGQKHAITYAKTIDEAMGILPSINPQADAAQSEDEGLTELEAVRTFKSALNGRPLRITDKTRARYVLFRAPPSRRLLKYVIRLLPRHPEHIDAFVHFLSKHRPAKVIVRQCAAKLKTSPYEYVKGEMWHLLAKFMKPQELRALIPRAVEDARDRHAGVALKSGALHFLCAAERAGLGKYGRFLMHQRSALLQALLVPAIPDARFAKGDVGERLLTRREFEPGVALAEHLVRLGLKPASLGVSAKSLPSQVRNTFRALGLMSRRAPQVDPMGEILSARLGIPQWDGWKRLLVGDYSHALQLLAIADATFDMGRSQWLSHQNSFNHTVFLAFQRWLQRKSKPGVVKTVGRDGKQLKFGTLVDPNQPFAATYSAIAAAFAAANTRRNSLPGSHPYDQKTGRKTRHLSKKEQTALASNLSNAYAEFIRVGSG